MLLMYYYINVEIYLCVNVLAFFRVNVKRIYCFD